MNNIRSKITASGSYLPAKILTNEDLASLVDTSDKWIYSRTGIKKRHISAEREYTSDLAAKALLDTLEKGHIDRKSIDGIILATTTPDQVFPATASIVQSKVGLRSGFAFDINAVCSGFVFALILVDSLIKSGMAKRIAVIGADSMSRIIDWGDRSTCVLFGDGAGCFIMDATREKNEGIISSCFHSDASCFDILKVSGGIAAGNLDAKLLMNGREIFKHAVEKMVSSSLEVLKNADMDISDIDWLLPHQANDRIMSAVADRLNFTKEGRVISAIKEHANTSAASIPLAFDHYVSRNSNDPVMKKDDNILITAFGAGLSWGSLIITL
jgi:3-oxoacyl-[acyl-carrier-protein] synthase III